MTFIILMMQKKLLKIRKRQVKELKHFQLFHKNKFMKRKLILIFTLFLFAITDVNAQKNNLSCNLLLESVKTDAFNKEFFYSKYLSETFYIVDTIGFLN